MELDVFNYIALTFYTYLAVGLLSNTKPTEHCTYSTSNLYFFLLLFENNKDDKSTMNGMSIFLLYSDQKNNNSDDSESYT